MYVFVSFLAYKLGNQLWELKFIVSDWIPIKLGFLKSHKVQCSIHSRLVPFNICSELSAIRPLHVTYPLNSSTVW